MFVDLMHEWLKFKNAILLKRFPITKSTFDINTINRPYYLTQYQDIFVQNDEGFNFVTGKTSPEFKD